MVRNVLVVDGLDGDEFGEVGEVPEGCEGALVEGEVLGVEAVGNEATEFGSEGPHFDAVETELLDLLVAAVVLDPVLDPIGYTHDLNVITCIPSIALL